MIDRIDKLLEIHIDCPNAALACCAHDFEDRIMCAARRPQAEARDRIALVSSPEGLKTYFRSFSVVIASTPGTPLFASTRLSAKVKFSRLSIAASVDSFITFSMST